MDRRDHPVIEVLCGPWPGHEPAGDDVVLRAGPLRLLPQRLQVEVGGRTVDLWPSEMLLLTLLVRHEGRVLTRKTLLAESGDAGGDQDLRSIDARVSRLRRKIGPAGRWIRTVKGGGYTWCAPEARPPRRLLGWLAPLAALWAQTWRRPATAATIGGCVGAAATVGALAFVSRANDPARSTALTSQALKLVSESVVPGPAMPSFGSFGPSVVYAGDGRFVTLVLPREADAIQPARLRSVRLEALPDSGPVLRELGTDRLRVTGSAVPPSASWGIGDGEAARASVGGTLFIARADGSAVLEFDQTGRLLREHAIDLSSDLAAGGGVEAVAVASRDEVLLAAARPTPDSRTSKAPMVLVDLVTGTSTAMAYPLDDPQGELRDMDIWSDGWLLVAESAGPTIDAGTRLYLVPIMDLASADSAVDKRLVLDTTGAGGNLGRFPLAGLSVGPTDPSDPARRLLILSAVANIEPTHLWLYSADLTPLLPRHALR